MAVSQELRENRARVPCAILSGVTRWWARGLVILSLGLSGCRDAPPQASSGRPIAQPEAEPKSKLTPPNPETAKNLPSTLASSEAKASLLRHREYLSGPLAEDAPIVFAAHGRGDTLEGFERLVAALRIEARVVVLEAPLSFGNRGFQWFEGRDLRAYEQLQTRIAELSTLKAEFAQRYPQTKSFGFFGFSQGGALAAHLALEAPSLFDSYASLSGFLLEGIQGQAHPMCKPALFVSVGAQDNVVAPERSWMVAQQAEALGLSVERFPFEGKHQVPPDVLRAMRSFFERTLVTRCQGD